MALTLPPDPPSTADPANFAAEADAFIAWMVTFVSELNTILGITIPEGSAAAATLTGDTLATNVTKSFLALINTTNGLFIDQGANDGKIIAFTSSDVAHGMTAIAATNVFGFASKIAGTDGGLFIQGLADNDVIGLALLGTGWVAETGPRSTASKAPIDLRASIKSADNASIVGADGNLMVLRDHNITHFVWDAEGSAFADVEWITFDFIDDLRLLGGLDLEMHRRRGTAVDAAFSDWVAESRDILQREGIFNFYDDGPRAMMNTTRMHMLEVGAIRQLGRAREGDRRDLDQVLELLPRVAALENRLGAA